RSPARGHVLRVGLRRASAVVAPRWHGVLPCGARSQRDHRARRVLRRRSGQAARRPRVAVPPSPPVLVRPAAREGRARARALQGSHRHRNLMTQVPEASPDASAAPPPSRVRRVLKRLWWFHSFFALSFGAGVMLFARAGLAHADKIMIALFASWLLMFVALRFIVGPANRRE